MIDLHCHILHGLDDGAETAAESLQMAHLFERTGYRMVAATPHMVPGTSWMPPIDRIKTRVTALNQTITDAGIELEIVPGMEIAIDPQIPDLLDDDRLLPLGNASCLLIEPAFQQLPPGWDKVIFAILAKGYSVLLAHPERCVQLAANPGLIDRLIGSGVYLQVNWGSFLGQYGRAVARTARLLAENGKIHCLATDSHRPDGHHPARIRAAAAELGGLIGRENLQRITTDNPLRVLNGEPPQPMTVSGAGTGRTKKRWWRLW
ncbi:MAG: phosphotransferase [Deltaproteobacteria bacterium]|nr:phosphotransferase [Deltaproteobacteria bacterium]